MNKKDLIANDGLKVQVITCNEIQIKKHVEIAKCYKSHEISMIAWTFFVFKVAQLYSLPQNQFTHMLG